VDNFVTVFLQIHSGIIKTDREKIKRVQFFAPQCTIPLTSDRGTGYAMTVGGLPLNTGFKQHPNDYAAAVASTSRLKGEMIHPLEIMDVVLSFPLVWQTLSLTNISWSTAIAS